MLAIWLFSLSVDLSTSTIRDPWRFTSMVMKALRAGLNSTSVSMPWVERTLAFQLLGCSMRTERSDTVKRFIGSGCGTDAGCTAKNHVIPTTARAEGIQIER